VLDTLTSLVNKSLSDCGCASWRVRRYHLLETIRLYALEKLIVFGEVSLPEIGTWPTSLVGAKLEARLKTSEQIVAIFQADAGDPQPPG
jgi:predicted ATPase